MVKLHYRVYGQGHPLLILHGLLGAGGNWHSLSRNVFAESLATYTLDLRNHGHSPHTEEMSYAAMARDVFEFAQDLHAGSVHVLGHSMGGKVAMQLALSYPQIVDRLIVVDVAPRAFDDDRPHVIEALKSIDLERHEDRKSIERALVDDFGSAPVRQFLLKNVRRSHGRYRWLPNLDALERTYPQIAGPITAKGIFEGDALFVRGEESDYIRTLDVDQIRLRFPAAQFVTVAGAGHWVHVDAPDEFARIVMDFLDKSVPAGNPHV